MWKESNRNIVVIFQPNILGIVGFYVRHSAHHCSTGQWFIFTEVTFYNIHILAVDFCLLLTLSQISFTNTCTKIQIWKNSKKNFPKELPKRISQKNYQQEFSKEFWKKLKKISFKIPKRIPNRIPNRIPKSIPKRIPKRIPNQFQKEFP